VRTALRAPDDFGAYLAFGLSTMFALQALVNLAVALAIVPTKGLTLPFVSFGGSSLVMNALAAGVLLNISRHVPETPRPPEKADDEEREAAGDLHVPPEDPDEEQWAT
jgi:cell division protein FtsW